MSISSSSHPLVLPPADAPLQLGIKIGSGGEATVWEVIGHPHLVCKCYRESGPPEVQRQRGEKLRLMLMKDELRRHRHFAWPQQLRAVENGYLMRRVSGQTLVVLSALSARRQRLPHWTEKHSARVVWSLAHGSELLERNDIFPGDINLNNFFLDPATGAAAFIDCDSYQIAGKGALLHSPVYTAEYQAPEVLLNQGPRRPIGWEQVSFSCAVLFCQILLGGAHPFQVMGNTGAPEENIVTGRCFMGGKSRASGWVQPGIFARYNRLTPWVKSLLRRTFIEGHQHPSARPRMNEWIKAMKQYGQSLEQPA